MRHDHHEVAQKIQSVQMKIVPLQTTSDDGQNFTVITNEDKEADFRWFVEKE